MSDNRPVHGCNGCNTTGGRMSCPVHRNFLPAQFPDDGTGWLGDCFVEVRRLQAEVERLQGLLAEQDREFNAENLRAERFKRERNEARKALRLIANGNWNNRAGHDLTARQFAARAAAKEER